MSQAPDPATPPDFWRRIESVYRDSPIHAAFGLSLHVLDAGSVEVHYHGASAGLNAHRVVAGGTLTTMLDSAIVQACRTRLGAEVRVATIEIKVNFVRAVPADTPLRAVGTVDYLGRSTAVGSARLLDEAGTVYGLGLATVAVRR